MRISDWSSDLCSSDLAPGNDAVSSTALTAAGATVILFTTGRGTPLGFPAPTLKIASNSALAQRKAGWIDFDAGTVLDAGFDGAADALFDLIAATASGAPTKAEANEERSEEHTSELQSLMRISYAVFCLKKKNKQ